MNWGRNKYSARKCTVDGITFDSRKEARRYQELKILQRAGEISDLKQQVKFDLLPPQYDANGKLRERGVSYIADFTYVDKNGNWIVEDAKGVRTPEYILKRKMMMYFHQIRIVEV